jgi:hypothetical protein
MGALDNLADRHFAKDDSGKLVFLPRGRRRAAYFVDSADENKIKSLVKLYIVSNALLNLTGMMATIGFTDWLTCDERPASLAHQLKFGAVVWAIAATVFYFAPAMLILNIYRRAVGGICASLTAVDPASVPLTPLPSSSRRVVLICLGAGCVLLGIAIFAMVSYRR